MKRDIDTHSESWRHECETRFVLNLRKQDKSGAHDYLELVARKRGQQAAGRLREDASRLWRQQ